MKRVLAATLYLTGIAAFGFMFGGFLGTRVFGGGGVGFDQLADAFGGMR